MESQTSVIRNGKKLITNYITDTPKEEQEIVNKSYVDELFDFVSTKEQTISDPDNTISLSTKITNIILNNADNTNIINLSFSHGGQNECTIVIYNKTGNSITLPTSFIIGNYTTVLVNKISSVTLLDKSSCEINVMFTNGECRILTIV